MANLPETSTFTSGIYQLERTDPVDAGIGGNGVSNLQAKQLADRTQWLKDQVQKGFAWKSVFINSAAGGLTSSDFGRLFVWDENAVSASIGLELPPIASMPANGEAHIGFMVGKPSGVTVLVQPDGADAMYPFGTSDFTLEAGDTLVLYPFKNPLVGGTHSWWPVVLPGSVAVNRANAAFAEKFVPTGSVVMMAGTSAPAGYLKLNGALLNRATYPALWAFAQASGALVAEASWSTFYGAFSSGNGSTTFRLPDFRGEFIRALDDLRGIDPSRSLGFPQAESVNTASVQLREASTTWASTGVGIGASVAYFENSNIPSYGTNMTLFGGAETRPRNLALLFCIKY